MDEMNGVGSRGAAHLGSPMVAHPSRVGGDYLWATSLDVLALCFASFKRA